METYQYLKLGTPKVACLRIFKLFLILLVSTYPVFGQKKLITISSGTKGGNYYKVGNKISKKLNDIYPEISFKILSSNGSVENIENLGNRISELAIVQRDVFIDNIFDEETGIKNLEIICPLFQEALLIYVKGTEGVITFNQLLERIKKKEVTKIGVGKQNSITEKILKKIFNQYSVDSHNLFEYAASYTDHISQVETGLIQSIAIYSAPLEKISNKDFAVVGFNKSQVDEIQVYQKNSAKIKLSSDQFLKIDADKRLYTLGTWSLLVGLTEDLYELDEALPKPLLDNLQKSFFQSKKDGFSNYHFEDVINNLHTVVEQEKLHTPKFLDGLPLNPELDKLINKHISSLRFSNLLLLAIILLIVLYVRHLIKRKKLRSSWLRYRHFIFAIGFVMVVYFSAVTILMNAEKELFESYNKKSGLLDIPRGDLHIWLITSSLTKEYNNIFPLSVTGKFIVSFLFYLNLIVIVVSASIEILIRKSTIKKRQGKMNITYTDHLVLCGWNAQSISLIEDSHEAIKKFHRSKERIVCIVNNPAELLEKSESLKSLFESRFLSFVDGDAKNESILEQSNIHKAKTVILLSEDNSQGADEKTLLRALSISRFCRKKTQNNDNKTNSIIDSIYLIAETNDSSFTEDLKRSDVNEVICTAAYGKNILIQSMLNHGVSSILNELLTFNEHNEFYSIDLRDSDFQELRWKTFDELLVFLRKYNILLLGIKSAYFDDNNAEIIDEELINEKLDEDKLVRQYMINPHSDSEVVRTSDDNDQLLVLCTSSAVISNLAKHLKQQKVQMS